MLPARCGHVVSRSVQHRVTLRSAWDFDTLPPTEPVKLRTGGSNGRTRSSKCSYRLIELGYNFCVVASAVAAGKK